MRIKDHPVLTFPKRKEVVFFFEGKKVIGYEGDTVASALHDLGILMLSKSIERKRPRGLYCAIGHCASCKMVVDGKPNVRTCITPLKENIKVERQTGKGVII